MEVITNLLKGYWGAQSLGREDPHLSLDVPVPGGRLSSAALQTVATQPCAATVLPIPERIPQCLGHLMPLAQDHRTLDV